MEKTMKPTLCRFSLAPMSDSFIEIILGAIAKVDTSRVSAVTDEFSTTYRGGRRQVLDALKACFAYSYREGVHMALNAVLEAGCPCRAEEDARVCPAAPADETLVNEAGTASLHFKTAVKFSLYSMGDEDYLDRIAPVIAIVKDAGLFVRSDPGATVMQGDVGDIFNCLEAVAAHCEANLKHYVIQLTLAVNLPEEA